MKKREFLVGALAVAGAELPILSAQAATVSASANPSRRLPPVDMQHSLDRWQRYVGQSFIVAGADQSHRVTLERVDVPAPAPHAAQGPIEQFSLLFSSGEAVGLPTGTHELRHHTGQRVSLYLDASSINGASAYRAHFSLIG